METPLQMQDPLETMTTENVKQFIGQMVITNARLHAENTSLTARVKQLEQENTLLINSRAKNESLKVVEGKSANAS